MVKSIPLHNSRLVAWVDDEDYERVAGFRRKLVASASGRRVPYAHSSTGIVMHRLLLGLGRMSRRERWRLGAKLVVVDHVNGDGLDNRRGNIRAVGCPVNWRNGDGAGYGVPASCILLKLTQPYCAWLHGERWPASPKVR